MSSDSTLFYDPKTGQAFTLDTGTTSQQVDMPSVTRLLSRKKLEDAAQAAATPQGGPPAPPVSSRPVSSTPPAPPTSRVATSPTLAAPLPNHLPPPPSPRTTASPAAAFRSSTIRTAKRRSPGSLQLETCPRPTSVAALDPGFRTLKAAFDAGAFSALLLQASAAEARATLAFEPGAKRLVWEGFWWDSGVAAETWIQLMKEGAVEFGPVGGATADSASLVLRAALGAGPKDFLTLVRAETRDHGSAILAIFSKNSLRAILPAKTLTSMNAARAA